MRFNKSLFSRTLLVGSLILSSSLNAQSAAVNAQQLELFSLEQQIPKLKGYDARARRIIVPAGATIDKHEHSTRAGIVYVESGEIIEYRYRGNEKTSRRLAVGETLIEDATTVHSYINNSKEDCVLIAFDIPFR
jgi:quercetin dioxygenase-like cupin family protein